MRASGLRRFLLLGALLAPGCVLAVGATITTKFSAGTAQPYLGSEHRDVVNEVAGKKLPLQEGLPRLQPVLAWCDAKVNTPEVSYVAVRSDAEAEDYRGQHPGLKKLVLLDVACPAAYKTVAFMYVDVVDYSRALEFLDKAIAISPFYNNAYSERGFILNQSGKPAAAADSYRQALSLLERYPDREQQALALRGLGYSLVETGDLGAAREAYSQSLKFDPDSKVARDELAYLDGAQSKAGTATAPGGDNALVPAVTPAGLSEAARKVIAYTRALESEPLGEQAPQMRSALIDWEAKTSEVSILMCDTTGLLSGNKSKYSAELMIQDMFGIAAWQLEHPGAWDDELAAQTAGVRSTLKAYAALLRAEPKAIRERLDELAAHEAAGDLAQTLAPIVAGKCRRDKAVEAGTK